VDKQGFANSLRLRSLDEFEKNLRKYISSFDYPKCDSTHVAV